MRIKLRRGFKDNPRPFDVRYKEKFLLFPLILDGELRWLESATIRQCYVSDVCAPRGFRWKNIEFEDYKG